MAAEDDEIDAIDVASAGYDEDPASGKQAKRTSPAGLQLLMAEFRRRSTGLQGAELEQELELLVDRIVDRHVAVAPPALRAQMRASIKGLLDHDPTLGAAVQNLRAKAGR